MVYKSLYIQIIIRVTLLLVTCMILGWIGLNREYIHTAVVVFMLLIAQVFAMIYYLNRTNRYLGNFFSSVQDRGTSLKIKTEASPYVSELVRKMNALGELIEQSRLETENERNYLKYLVENIEVGIITFHENGRVDLINSGARKILKAKEIQSIKDLNKYKKDFPEILFQLQPGKHTLVNVIVENELVQLALRKSILKMKEKTCSLISFQDINLELDRKELDSWQKIIRVLAHEIISTITPIISLSKNQLKQLRKNGRIRIAAELSNEIVSETVEGLEIINKRGKGLIKFVENYRSLTHLPEPEIKKFKLNKLLNRIIRLIKSEFPGIRLHFKLFIPPNLSLLADEKLLEQVILNLLHNSVYALRKKKVKEIAINAGEETSNNKWITIRDNGCGIETENLENIFIPFFTTHKKGSGIGLSLAKQIMRVHNGNITVRSEPGKFTEFKLKFNQ
jgi:two-component system nitrogen regulation sensor histidine kinase NtrY